MEHSQIISKLNNMDEDNLQEVLEGIVDIVLDYDSEEKLSDL